MKTPNWIDLDKGKMHSQGYFQEMEKSFPWIKDELRRHEDDLIHVKMEVFASYTNEQIRKGDERELVRCFHFQEERLEKIDSVLVNAIYVSYCETLLVENEQGIMKEKKGLMGRQLKWYYDNYEKYYQELFKE